MSGSSSDSGATAESFSDFVQQPDLDGADQLQFGIEVEFLAKPVRVPQGVEYEDGGYEDLTQDYCYHHIAAALRDAGLDAAFHSRTAPHKLPGALVGDGHVHASRYLVCLKPRAAEPSRSTPLHLRLWVLKHELTVHAEYGSGFLGSIPTELNTPVLPQSEAASGFPLVNRALDAVLQSRNGRIHINESCGMHVHVSPAGGMRARHVKRLATLLLVVEEHLLFRLCADHRRPWQSDVGTRLDALERAPELSVSAERLDRALASEEVAEDVPEALAAARRTQLARIWACTEATELERVVSRRSQVGIAPCAMAFRILARGRNREEYTFEFRHAQASLSKGFVDNWVAVVLAVCKLAFVEPRRLKGALQMLSEAVSEAEAKGCGEEAWSDILTLLAVILGDDLPCELDESFWRARLESDMEEMTGGMDVDGAGNARGE